MKKISEMDVSDRMRLKIIGKEIHNSKREYIEKLKIEDLGSYLILRESQKKGLAKFRKKNPDYNKNWEKKRSGK
ncbi:hypothetical protein ES705_37985 [subsurface metagenome]